MGRGELPLPTVMISSFRREQAMRAQDELCRNLAREILEDPSGPAWERARELLRGDLLTPAQERELLSVIHARTCRLAEEEDNYIGARQLGPEEMEEDDRQALREWVASTPQPTPREVMAWALPRWRKRIDSGRRDDSEAAIYSYWRLSSRPASR